MAEQQKIQCREHGGYFYREAKRGRKPVRCGGEYDVCDADKVVPTRTRQQVVDTGVAENAGRKLKVRVISEEGDVTRVAIEGPRGTPKAQTAANASMTKGKAAKELLEAQGWDVSGKAWVADPPDDRPGSDYWASVTAARGEEMLHIVWRNGEVQDQVYNLWNLDKPSANGRPNANLPFDPDTIPDSELAQYLVGVKVTWWNRLAGKEQKAICGRDRIQIERNFTGTGDEYPAARIVKFLDAEGNGFQAFRLDQLIKVG